jgi:hypothetical protein
MGHKAGRQGAGFLLRPEFEGERGLKPAQYYLAQAVRLWELAEAATIPSAREGFDLVAVQYKRLADEVEALEKYRKG